MPTKRVSQHVSGYLGTVHLHTIAWYSSTRLMQCPKPVSTLQVYRHQIIVHPKYYQNRFMHILERAPLHGRMYSYCIVVAKKQKQFGQTRSRPHIEDSIENNNSILSSKLLFYRTQQYQNLPNINFSKSTIDIESISTAGFSRYR